MAKFMNCRRRFDILQPNVELSNAVITYSLWLFVSFSVHRWHQKPQDHRQGISINILCTIDHLSMKKQTGELQLMLGMRGSKRMSTLETISIIWIGIGMTSGCLVLPQLPAPPTTAPISSGSFYVLWGLANFSLFYFLFCTLCTKSQISGLVISLTNMNIFATIFIVGSM